MLDAIKKLLGGGGESRSNDDLDPQLASAALFVEAALVDGVYAELEEGRVRRVLMAAFDLSETEAQALLEKGEALAEDSVDAYQFTRRVKTLELSQRERVIEGLYEIALADGERCAFEDAFIRHVASLLHVDDVRRARARQRAEQRQTGN